MITSARIVFELKNLHLKKRIDELLATYGVTQFPIVEEKHIQDGDITYEVKIPYNAQSVYELMNTLKNFPEQIIRNPYFTCTFTYTSDEINDSPLFRILGVGNVSSRYPTNKGKHQRIPFCSTCQRYILERTTPITINTSILRRYEVVFSDGAMVISERVADLLETWKATGYRLDSVLHKGPEEKRVPAYEVIATNVLPPQSIPDYVQADPNYQSTKCPDCGLGSRPKYPIHYHASVRNHIQDFNQMHEWSYHFEIGTPVSKKILISDRLKNLFKEHGFYKKEFFEPMYGKGDQVCAQDWTFEPVILTD